VLVGTGGYRILTQMVIKICRRCLYGDVATWPGRWGSLISHEMEQGHTLVNTSSEGAHSSSSRPHPAGVRARAGLGRPRPRRPPPRASSSPATPAPPLLVPSLPPLLEILPGKARAWMAAGPSPSRGGGGGLSWRRLRVESTGFGSEVRRDPSGERIWRRQWRCGLSAVEAPCS
jgi:hypothetical protein